jgi:hypothetical protein
MKQTNINIEEIKRFPTVTNPISAPDLNVPQAYAYSLRRAIVIDCNQNQRAELIELLSGKNFPEGVCFNNTKDNRHRLHVWQNSESRKERASILGNGWQWIEGINHGTQPGDLIACIDGTRGRVTKADPESCVIEFETENGQYLSVAGYFRKERTTLQAPREIKPEEQAFNDVLTISEGDKVLSKHYGTIGTVTRIYKEKGKTLYDVEFEQPIKCFWTDEMKKATSFSRDGITKNFDAEGREIVGSPVYYAEELQADYWLGKARTIFDIEMFPPTERRPQWVVVYDIFSTPKLATLFEISSYLSALYQEHRAA